MADFFCKKCGDPVEVARNPRGGAVVHMGQNYLISNVRSGLEPDEKEQLEKWSHAIKPVDKDGRDANFHIGHKSGRY